MFEGFEPFTIQTQDEPPVSIYGLKSTSGSSGSGSDTPLPPLVLLHGFPQSHLIWHRVAPRLTDKYSVIVMDLRGYGASSKPGGDVAQYAKSVMARDCVKVVDALGFVDEPFFVCAHDRGARVAHKLCVDFPLRVRAAVFLDICPTLAMYTKGGFEFATRYFHWYLLIQREPLPETLLSAAPRSILKMLMGGDSLFDDRAFEAYARGFEDPAQVHAMCQEYRAGATLDLDEARADLREGRLIRSPLRVIVGEQGVVHRLFDAPKEWRDVTEPGVDVEVRSVESGHFIPEQVPDVVVSDILEFLK